MKSKYYFEINRPPELTHAEERNAKRADRRMCRNYRQIISSDFRFVMQKADGYKIPKRNRSTNIIKVNL